MPSGRHHWAFVGFLLATLVCTLPIATEMGSALMGLGDTLLNSWILAWEVHSLFGPGETRFFDTNIFYPHANTLAYSELLIPQLLVAAPVILASGNPVLAHNVVLLFSILTTALGSYALAFWLTESRSASFAAGLILAFCPFMFGHLVHVQILFAGGIPLTFLFLFRWMESGRSRDAALVGLFYSIQALANGYYAVYLTFFAGIALLGLMVRKRRWAQQRFWLQLGLIALIAFTLMAPFYWHYLQLRQEMGFQRVLPSPTPLSAYLATPEINRLYGEITEAFARPEASMFPGLVPATLALIGLFRWARSAERPLCPSDGKGTSRPPTWNRFRILDGSIVAMATLLLMLAMGWAVDTHLGPIPVRIASLRNPLLLFAVLIGVRTWMHRRWPEGSRPFGLPSSGWTFPLILISAAVLSLGTAPYQFLYRWIPGFGSLRAIPRIHVMFMVALAILAAQGMTHVLVSVSGTRRRMLAVALPVLIVLEYIGAPLPVVAAPRPDEFPAAHRWLAQQDDDLVFMEYPLRISDNILRLYYSTRHWRRMVNGFSGFIPPLYRELASKGRFFPNASAVKDLQDLGVDLLLVDTRRFREQRRLRIESNLDGHQALEQIANLNGTVVYRIDPHPAAAQAAAAEKPDWEALEPANLEVRASFDNESVRKVLDGNHRTDWRSPMSPGQWLEVGWNEDRDGFALELDISGSPHDYPRGYRLEVSPDGKRWTTVEEVEEFHPPIAQFLRPRDFVLRFEWSEPGARRLRFVQTGEDSRRPWTVVELRVLNAPS